MAEHQVNTDNKLIISIDWLSFTFHSDYTPEDVIEFMGLNVTDFREMPNGANGYKHMKKYENISVLYDGASNMGIHVNITGSSVGTVICAYKESIAYNTPFGKAYIDLDKNDTVLSRFFVDMFHFGGTISRLDLAIDDYCCNYYSLDEIEKKLVSGRVITKWKSSRELKEKINATSEKIGHTLYFGSAQSDIQLRIYDKQLERNKGLEPGNENYIEFPWVRWELELHKDRANEIGRLLSSGFSVGTVAVGVLAHYFRVIRLDDSNKSRCSSEKKWQMFIDNVQALKITVQKRERTLEEEIRVFEMQQGRKVAKLFYACGGNSDYFADLTSRYEHKLTPRDLEQLGL